jgi:hypothetical protein
MVQFDRRSGWLSLPLAIALVGCGNGEESTTTDDAQSTGLVTSSGGTGDGGDSDGGSNCPPTGCLDAAGGSTGMADGGDPTGEGCEKVDILFVIDNSGSMEDEQSNLLAGFPGFISAIQSQLAGVGSYHIGVTTTDAYLFNGSGCQVDGALVTQTGGTGSSSSTCGPYAEGFNFMTEADNLSVAFSCAGQVGISGDGNERPISTIQGALSDGMNQPGGCNDGFVRDDAILVIVMITDEEDDHEIDGCLQTPQPGSPGDPAGWFIGVTSHKQGVESNIVVLSLVGPPGPTPAICPELDKCSGGITGAEVATRLVQFTQMFTHGFIGRVCEPTYDQFFSQAVAVIGDACDGFIPPN